MPVEESNAVKGLRTSPSSAEALRDRLRAAYNPRGGIRWEDVGAQFGITAAMAWRIAVQGYVPSDKGIRYRLGLEDDQPVQDPVKPRMCGCGNLFRPNVPWRDRCYSCSPMTRKRR